MTRALVLCTIALTRPDAVQLRLGYSPAGARLRSDGVVGDDTPAGIGSALGSAAGSRFAAGEIDHGRGGIRLPTQGGIAFDDPRRALVR